MPECGSAGLTHPTLPLQHQCTHKPSPLRNPDILFSFLGELIRAFTQPVCFFFSLLPFSAPMNYCTFLFVAFFATADSTCAQFSITRPWPPPMPSRGEPPGRARISPQRRRLSSDVRNKKLFVLPYSVIEPGPVSDGFRNPLSMCP